MLRAGLLAAGFAAANALSRVEVWNDCHDDPRVPFMVVANQGMSEKEKGVSRDDYLCPQTVKLLPGESVTYEAPSEGLPSTRFWGMAGCDDATGLCTWSQSVVNSSGFPAIDSKYTAWGYGTQPPAFSYFEVTFGCNETDPKKCRDNPSGKHCGEKLSREDWFDLSAVDGLTPLSVEIEDPDGVCVTTDKLKGPSQALLTLQGGQFDMQLCKFTWYLRALSEDTPPQGIPDIDLRVVDIDGNVLGCASPCQRLTHDQSWFTDGQPLLRASPDFNATVPTLPIDPGSDAAAYYCCAGQAKNSTECESGLPWGNRQRFQVFDEVNNPYYSLVEQQVYSEPFSDNQNVNPNRPKVNFNCPTGNLIFNVRLHCPLNEKVNVTKPPAGEMIGLTYAKQRRYDTDASGSCMFDRTNRRPNPIGGSCPARQAGESRDCEDCSAYAAPQDFMIDEKEGVETVQCACAPYVKMKVPAPTSDNPKWADPAACPRITPPPQPAVCPMYTCKDMKCMPNDNGTLTEHECKTTCGVAPVYKCNGSPGFDCMRVEPGTPSATSLEVCRHQCTSEPVPPPPPPAPVYKCDEASKTCKEVPPGTADSKSFELCKSSCPSVSLPEPTPKPPKPPTPTPAPSLTPCVDKTWWCKPQAHWCVEYPEVMAGFCPRTCKTCAPTTEECYDKEDYCVWVSRFMCVLSPHLRASCPATCGSCAGSAPAKVGEPEPQLGDGRLCTTDTDCDVDCFCRHGSADTLSGTGCTQLVAPWGDCASEPGCCDVGYTCTQEGAWQWCKPSAGARPCKAERRCVPRVVEGGECGGSTSPCGRRECALGLACVGGVCARDASTGW